VELQNHPENTVFSSRSATVLSLTACQPSGWGNASSTPT